MAPTIYAQTNWQTIISAPEGERITHVICGDCDANNRHLNSFVDYASDTFVAIKATRKGAQTDLHLVMESGNIYPFIVVEVSRVPAAIPDIQVIIEPTDAQTLEAISPKRTAPDMLEVFRSQFLAEEQAQELAALKEQLEQTRTAAQAKPQQQPIPSGLRYDYRFKKEASRLPFNVQKIGENGKFTLIWANPSEAFTVYEIQDGKPNLVPIKPHEGYYVIETVIQKGELVIGKRKLAFRRDG